MDNRDGREGGERRLRRFLRDGGIVPLQVRTDRADIEQITDDVLELVAGDRDLKPGQRNQDEIPTRLRSGDAGEFVARTSGVMVIRPLG